MQAKANGIQLCKVPPELSDLNALKLRLIGRRVPFMKMVALPSGKQRSIHGQAVNVPSKVDTICNMLPSKSELIPPKLKRKICDSTKGEEDRMIGSAITLCSNTIDHC